MSYEINEYFLDGTKIDSWFYNYEIPDILNNSKKYVLTDYDIKPNGEVSTKKIQGLIDLAYESGGGVIVVPEGEYISGALYFKQGVNLYISKNGILKGSDNPIDYDIVDTRIEGQSCRYLSALINADGLDGFTIFGDGIIDGNGLRTWESFWHRRKWNPKCTNKDEQRARIIYISNSTNVLICNVTLQNSQFWTSHIYKCKYVRYLNCTIKSPSYPIKAPSTDAIDIDASSDVLIKNCYLEVNDDAIALKGGKGVNAHNDSNNGINERIIIEDCTYGYCHSCLTCGSESIHNKNIIVRRIKVLSSKNLLWLKMRPDTKQLYEYILLDQIDANVTTFFNVNSWVQFLELDNKNDDLKSIAKNITIKNATCRCVTNFNVKENESLYSLENFTFENLLIKTKFNKYNEPLFKNIIFNNVKIEIDK